MFINAVVLFKLQDEPHLYMQQIRIIIIIKKAVWLYEWLFIAAVAFIPVCSFTVWFYNSPLKNVIIINIHHALPHYQALVLVLRPLTPP